VEVGIANNPAKAGDLDHTLRLEVDSQRQPGVPMEFN
jgi:hypothetical protein